MTGRCLALENRRRFLGSEGLSSLCDDSVFDSLLSLPWQSSAAIKKTFCDGVPKVQKLKNVFFSGVEPGLLDTVSKKLDNARSKKCMIVRTVHFLVRVFMRYADVCLTCLHHPFWRYIHAQYHDIDIGLRLVFFDQRRQTSSGVFDRTDEAIMIGLLSNQWTTV